MKRKYIVISCEMDPESDKATWFADEVLAEDNEQAIEIILGIRDSCDGAAYSADELRRWADDLDSSPHCEIEAGIEILRRSYGHEG